MNRRELLAFAAAGTLSGALAACGKDKAVTDHAGGVVAVKAARMPAGSAADAGADLTAFGARMFLANKSIPATGNGSISPYSIYAALAMTEAGARGATRRELDGLLGGDQARLSGNMTAIDAAVAKAVQDGNHIDPEATVVQSANSLWPDANLQVRQDFLRELATGYAAGVHLVDYTKDPDGARQQINAWVAERTRTLIPELLSPGSITPATRLELVNALYLKAQWAKEFSMPMEPEAFVAADGRSLQRSLMGVRASFGMASGSDWSSVTVPYLGQGLAMTIVMPDAGRFSAVRSQLATVLPQAVKARAGGGQVALSMPGFKIDTGSALTDAIRSLGAAGLFDRADLSGIAGSPGELAVDHVIHQSVVKVDRHGTEAAAATAIGVRAVAMPQRVNEFTVDRAFFFVIHDTTTYAPLFLGQISDPAAAS